MLEDVTWEMLKEKLKESIGSCASDIVEAFRFRASTLFPQHGGVLPTKETEKLIEDVRERMRLVFHAFARRWCVKMAG